VSTHQELAAALQQKDTELAAAKARALKAVRDVWRVTCNV
jgi:hypothetical protein